MTRFYKTTNTLCTLHQSDAERDGWRQGKCVCICVCVCAVRVCVHVRARACMYERWVILQVKLNRTQTIYNEDSSYNVHFINTTYTHERHYNILNVIHDTRGPHTPT